MNETKLVELLHKFRFKRIKKASGGYMASCPFSSKTHSKKRDYRPSFGISMSNPSVFNCFSCHRNSYLTSLPSMLEFELGGDFSEMRDFIIKNESYSFRDYDESSKSRPYRLPALNEQVLETYTKVPEPVKKKLNLTDGIIYYFELCFDGKENRLIIPMRDSFRRLIAIKTRYTGTDKYTMDNYKFLFMTGKEIKKSGHWYNMDKRFVNNKALCVTESESDLWSLYETGLVSNIWCSLGASITESQLYTISQISSPIVIMTDNDKEGEKALKKIAGAMDSLAPVYRITNYYGEKDVADLCHKKKIKRALNSIGRV